MDLRLELKQLLVSGFSESDFSNLFFQSEFATIRHDTSPMMGVNKLADLIVKHVVKHSLWTEIFQWIKDTNPNRYGFFIQPFRSLDWSKVHRDLMRFEEGELRCIEHEPAFRRLRATLSSSDSRMGVAHKIIDHTRRNLKELELFIFIEKLKIENEAKPQ